MDKETYEALKRIIAEAKKSIVNPQSLTDDELDYDIRQVDSWIDEVAKEYTE